MALSVAVLTTLVYVGLLEAKNVTVTDSNGRSLWGDVQCAAGCASKQCPLIVALHGMGDDTTSMLNRLIFRDSWVGPSHEFEDGDYCIVFPDGTWSNRYAEDVPRVTSLVQEVLGSHNIDRQGVFLLGYSQGAYVGYYIGCHTEFGETFAAFSLWSGSPARSGSRTCCPRRDFHLMHAHGTADTRVPWPTPRGACEDIPDFVRDFGVSNGCHGSTTSLPGGVDVFAYEEGCTGRGSSTLYRYNGATHTSHIKYELFHNAFQYFMAHYTGAPPAPAPVPTPSPAPWGPTPSPTLPPAAICSRGQFRCNCYRRQPSPYGRCCCEGPSPSGQTCPPYEFRCRCYTHQPSPYGSCCCAADIAEEKEELGPNATILV